MAAAFSQANRLLKLSFAADAGLADDTLLPFELQGWEHCSEGYAYALDCLAADAHLELKQFIGVPAQLSLRTDDGQERALCGLVTEARQEGSNGGFARYRQPGRRGRQGLRRQRPAQYQRQPHALQHGPGTPVPARFRRPGPDAGELHPLRPFLPPGL